MSSGAKLGTASDGRLPKRTELCTKRLLLVDERCDSKELGLIGRLGALDHLTLQRTQDKRGKVQWERKVPQWHGATLSETGSSQQCTLLSFSLTSLREKGSRLGHYPCLAVSLKSSREALLS